MAKVNTIQTNFTAGEIAPIMKGRVDIARYFNGVARMENFIIRPQGGVTRRSGTRFINEVKDSSKSTILQRFEFSKIQAYVLEFGENYIRVFRDEGIVDSVPGTPVEIVTTYTEAQLPDLTFTQSADILYICHEAHPTRKLSRTSHTAWTLVDLATTDGPYLDANVSDNTMTLSSITDRITLTSDENDFVVGDVGDYVEYTRDGEQVIGLVKAYVSATEVTIEPYLNILAEIDIEATFVSAVVPNLIATHDIFDRHHVGSFVKATDATDDWHLITAYDGANRDRVTIAAALTMVTLAVGGNLRTSGQIVTATVTATDAVFAATDVGRHIRFNFSGQQVWGVLGAFTSTTVMAVTIKRSMPLKDSDTGSIRADGISKLWRLGAWGSAIGYPSAVTFHEQRLVFANATNEPQTVWMSKSADFENFAPTEEDSIVLDDNAITYTISSDKVNAIEWLESGPVLLKGTTGSEWITRATSTAQPITPTNISASQQTAHGTSNVKPVRIGAATIFLQKSANKLRELVYNFEIDSYVARDLTVLSEHILRDGSGGVDLAYQQEPNSVIWCPRSDGQLVGFTYLKEHEVLGWHRHILGGSFSTGAAVVESVAVVPSADGTEDTLYMIVKRTVNGSTVRYVEFLENDFRPATATDKDDMFFVDSGLTYSGAPATVIAGLDHLEGETVAVLADGSARPDEVVSGGQIELATEASVVQAGLQFTSLLQTLPLEGGSENGTSQGKTKRISRITLRILNSLGFRAGETEASAVERSFRSTDDPMDSSPDLFTGDIRVDPEFDYETDADYFVMQKRPYPLTVIALMPESSTHR